MLDSMAVSSGRNKTFLALFLTALMVLCPIMPLAMAQVQGTIPAPSSYQEEPNAGINGVDKDMTFYLHYVNDTETSKTVIDKSTWYYYDTTQQWNDVNATIRVSAAQQTLKWYLYPVLAHDFTVNSFDFVIWAQRIAGAGHPNKVIKIYEKDEDGETLIHSKNHGAGPGIVVTPTEQHWGSDAAWGGHTFKAGNSIVMALEMNPGAGNTFDLLFDTASADSRVEFNSDDSLDIDSVYMLDSEDMSRKDLDPMAINKTVRIRANVTDPLGGYDIKWVNITLTDPNTNVLLDNMTMAKVQGSPNTYLNIYEKEWNYSGHPAGEYDVTIWSVDNNGYFHVFYHGNLDYGDYYVRKDWNFTVGEIAFMNIKVVDSKDVPLVGAYVVAALNDTKVIEGTNTTNATGMVNLTLFSAEYEITVFWADTVVAIVTYALIDNVTEASPFNISASVYYPLFKFKDGRGLALENASVTLVYPNNTISRPFRTNTTGEFNLSQVPGGPYLVIVRWRDIEVNNTILDIMNNTNHTLSTHVYYMKVIARDDIGGVLPGAQIVIANNTTTIVFDSKVTNLTGVIESRLPAGVYDVSIYWQNTLVYEKLNVTFLNDTTIDALTGIYVMNITALDGHMAPVTKARVLVLTSHQSLLESNFTDEDGIVRSRLPVGNHIIRAYWREVLVNETSVNLTDNHDITLALDINYPTVRVLDEAGTPVTNARVDIYYAGTNKLYGTGITDEDGETIYRIPASCYDVRVTWYDRLVNISTDILLDSDDVLMIGASIHNLLLKIVDPHEVPVENALVEVSFTGEHLVGTYNTDVEGLTSLRLPSEMYDIKVFWIGILVHEEEAVQLDAGTSLTLVADIWYVNVTPVDSRAVELEGALVTLMFTQDGSRFGALSTGTSGTVVFRIPTSEYDITVIWQDHMVFNGTGFDLTADQAIELPALVYYIHVTVLDSRSLVLKGATVTISDLDTGAEVATWTVDPPDKMDLRLPADGYMVDATWKGVLVNQTMIELDQDIDIELQAWVHYLTLTLVDSRDVPLKDATVTISLTEGGDQEWNARTDEYGIADFKLPGRTPLNVTALWSGVKVLDITDYVLTSDATEVMNANVHYVTLELMDTTGQPVENAKVVLRLSDNGQVMATGSTSTDGKDEFRLPATEYSVESDWWGVRIYQGTLVVLSDLDQTLVVDVSYLTVSVQDSRDVALVGAWVNLALGSTGTTFGAGLTDENGTVTIRLPHESYAITVYWNRVRVASEPTMDLDQDETFLVKARVHYLDVLVLDDRNIPVEDALVTVTRSGDTALSSVAPTSASGETTFRLPWGEYIIDVSWRDVEVARDLTVDLQADDDMTVNARVFYLSFKAKDSNGASLKGVRVRVEDKSGHVMGEGVTDGKGVAEFRLPVGTYTAYSRFVTTQFMTPVDISLSSEVSLTSSLEHVEKFSDYPAPVYKTKGFLFSILSLMLIIILVLVVVIGLRRRGAKATPETDEMEEYPPKDDEDEVDEDDEDEDEVDEDDEDEDEVDEDDEDEDEEDVGDGRDLDAKVDETEAPAEDSDVDMDGKSPLEKILDDVSDKDPPMEADDPKKEVDE